jgi:transcriptional regulator with XRE-family HTH domain
MSTKQFAAELGITAGLLGSLEAGHTVPSARVQEAFVGLMAETPRLPLPEPEGEVPHLAGAVFTNERLRAGLRISEFSELLGIDSARLASLEAGAEPTDAECAALIQLCGPSDQQAA